MIHGNPKFGDFVELMVGAPGPDIDYGVYLGPVPDDPNNHIVCAGHWGSPPFKAVQFNEMHIAKCSNQTPKTETLATEQAKILENAD